MKRKNIVVLKSRKTVFAIEKINPDVDLEDAICAATRTYCATSAGNRMYLKLGSRIRYTDFKKYVPNEICEKYGFRKIDKIPNIKPIQIKYRYNLCDNRFIFEADLKPETTVFISGTVTYSRILSLIDGEELKKVQISQKLRNITPISHPYGIITIKDAIVVPQSKNGLPSLEDQYAMIQFYRTERTNYSPTYTIIQRKTLPEIVTIHDGKAIPYQPSKEPYGKPVILVTKLKTIEPIPACKLMLESVIIRNNDDQITDRTNSEHITRNLC